MDWTDAAGTRPRRHARVWLDAASWQAHRAGGLDPADVVALDDWIRAGRATVARRRDPGSDACCLAVALPWSRDRRRIGFAVAAGAVVRIEAPLRLDQVVDAAPVAWRPALRALVERGLCVDTTFHVYGSLAWQAISGERCTGPDSDVDLLFNADTPDRIDRVLRLLTDWEADSGLRADGEARLANGDGIAWRELLGAPRRVLVKHQDRVSLQPYPT